MNRLMRPAFVGLVALGILLALPVTAAHHEWDQAAATELAKQLAEAAGDVRQSVRRSPPPPPGSSQRRIHFQALDDLRVLQSSVNSLARQLERGVGREESYPTFQRIRTLRNDIARLAQQADVQEPTLTKLSDAQAILDKLAPMYAPEDPSS